MHSWQETRTGRKISERRPDLAAWSNRGYHERKTVCRQGRGRRDRGSIENRRKVGLENIGWKSARGPRRNALKRARGISTPKF